MHAALAHELYVDVEKLILHTCHKIHRRYTFLEFEEIHGMALVEYCEAVNNYSQQRGTFEQWVVFCIWGGLLDRIKRLANRNRILRRKQLSSSDPDDADCDGMELVADRQPAFDRLAFLDQLSSDAQALASMLFNEAESDLLLCLRLANGNTPRQHQKAIAEYLNDMGWASERVQSTLDELRAVFIG